MFSLKLLAAFLVFYFVSSTNAAAPKTGDSSDKNVGRNFNVQDIISKLLALFQGFNSDSAGDSSDKNVGRNFNVQDILSKLLASFQGFNSDSANSGGYVDSSYLPRSGRIPNEKSNRKIDQRNHDSGYESNSHSTHDHSAHSDDEHSEHESHNHNGYDSHYAEHNHDAHDAAHESHNHNDGHDSHNSEHNNEQYAWRDTDSNHNNGGYAIPTEDNKFDLGDFIRKPAYYKDDIKYKIQKRDTNVNSRLARSGNEENGTKMELLLDYAIQRIFFYVIRYLSAGKFIQKSKPTKILTQDAFQNFAKKSHLYNVLMYKIPDKYGIITTFSNHERWNQVISNEGTNDLLLLDMILGHVMNGLLSWLCDNDKIQSKYNIEELVELTVESIKTQLYYADVINQNHESDICKLLRKENWWLLEGTSTVINSQKNWSINE